MWYCITYKNSKVAKVVLEMWFALQQTVEIYFLFLCMVNYLTDFTLLIILHLLLLLFEYLKKRPGNLLWKDHVVRNLNEEFSQNSLKYTKIVSQNNYQKSMPFQMADDTIYQSKEKCGLFSECQSSQSVKGILCNKWNGQYSPHKTQ